MYLFENFTRIAARVEVGSSFLARPFATKRSLGAAPVRAHSAPGRYEFQRGRGVIAMVKAVGPIQSVPRFEGDGTSK